MEFQAIGKKLIGKTTANCQEEKSAGATSDAFVQVGWVRDAHGIKGELYVQLMSDRPEWVDDLKVLFLRSPQDSETQEMKIRSKRFHKKGLIVKVEGVVNRNQAEDLKRWLMLLPSKDLSVVDENSYYLYAIKGFEVFDKEGKCLGKISDFSSNGRQDLLLTRNEDGLFAIPLVKELVVKEDFDQKRIVMDIPDGLFLDEMNLEPRT